MSSDRREFLGKAAAVTAALGARALPLSAQRAATMPTPRASALMELFGLRYPIFSAGMGVNAVPEVVRRRVSQTKSATSRPFAVNFLLPRDPVALPLALDAGAPIIQFAWGIPTAEAVAAVRKAGAKMGIQISSVAGARRALDVGADCQGTGGHVQATGPLYETVSAVIDEAKTVPVLAAGGIANGTHIRRALLAGASGVLIGTRFVATREAGAHQEYKTAITRATAADTVLTEGDVIATNTVTGVTKRRYGTANPGLDDQGTLQELALWAGQGVDAIRDTPSAGELVGRLWRECLDA